MPAPTSTPPRSFAELDDAIPRYDSFFTINDHHERNRALADEYNHVTYRDLGESAGGDPLWAVTVGNGSRTALLFGAPHPNEPIGSMTIDFLLHELADNDELRASLDYKFICMPVADSNGVRKNEGWFDGPFTLANYAANFYRPPPHRQVEATFPVEREQYVFDDPIPATKALADLIEAHHPDLIYSFHNTGFGGCYYLFTEQLEPLWEPLQDLPGEYGIPLDLGEPEVYDSEAFEEPFYRLLTFDDQYEGAVSDEHTDPEEVLFGGTAYDYARQFNDDVVEMIVELPYFYEPRIGDDTELDCSRETVIREGTERRRELLREWQAAAMAVEEFLPDTPMAQEAAGTAFFFEDRYDDKIEWAAMSPETDEPATVAQAVDARYVRDYQLLPYVGMLLRTIDHAVMGAVEEEARNRLLDAKDALEDVFHEWIGELQAELDYETLPIWKLVAVQARAGLLCLDYRQREWGR